MDIDGNSEQRRILLDSQAAINRSSQSIINSQVVAIETEQIGTEVISELGEQRETLLRAKSRLTHTDQELDKSKKLLLAMKRKVFYNKFLLILIILLEITILACSVYMKFFTK